MDYNKNSMNKYSLKNKYYKKSSSPDSITSGHHRLNSISDNNRRPLNNEIPSRNSMN